MSLKISSLLIHTFGVDLALDFLLLAFLVTFGDDLALAFPFGEVFLALTLTQKESQFRILSAAARASLLSVSK